FAAVAAILLQMRSGITTTAHSGASRRNGKSCQTNRESDVPCRSRWKVLRVMSSQLANGRSQKAPQGCCRDRCAQTAITAGRTQNARAIGLLRRVGESGAWQIRKRFEKR